jgi:hypothetical protein
VSANRSYDIGASMSDFRLQGGEGVTLGGERLKSFERDKACEGLRVCRAHEGKSTLAKLVLPLKAKEQSCHSDRQLNLFGQNTQLSQVALVEVNIGTPGFSLR